MIMNISPLGLSWASYPLQQSLDADSVCWRHLPNATECEQRNIPLEPARAGVQDGLMTDSIGYRPRSGHDYEKEYGTWDNHNSSKTLTSSVNLWLGENNIIQGVEDSPRKERVLERAETMTSHWPVLLTKQPVTSVDWSTATGWKPNFVEQKCWWRNPPNHRDLPRKERSKGTDWVWSGPKLLKRRSGK